MNKRRPAIPSTLSEQHCEGHPEKWRSRLGVLRKQDKWLTRAIGAAEKRLEVLVADRRAVKARMLRTEAVLGIVPDGHQLGCQCRRCVAGRAGARSVGHA